MKSAGLHVVIANFPAHISLYNADYAGIKGLPFRVWSIRQQKVPPHKNLSMNYCNWNLVNYANKFL